MKLIYSKHGEAATIESKHQIICLQEINKKIS